MQLFKIYKGTVYRKYKKYVIKYTKCYKIFKLYKLYKITKNILMTWNISFGQTQGIHLVTTTNSSDQCIPLIDIIYCQHRNIIYLIYEYTKILI